MKYISFVFILLLFGCSGSKKVVEKPEPEPETKIEIKEVEKIITKTDTVYISTVDTVIQKIYVNQPTTQKTAYSPNTPLNVEEFRAAWIATVANINWPSKKGLSTAQQQAEAIDLLNFLQTHNFNAAILQIRPQADALYQSSIEPWSYFLTGEQGKAPNPYYDPLQFWITEAHARNIELHVWLNPYRAHHSTGGTVTNQSIIKKRPGLAVELANGMWWLDPANQQVQQLTTDVVLDVVRRYDIDGVHFDDYFYPYDSYNEGKDFPDNVSWSAYLQTGGQLKRNDWRRDHVNRFIEQLYRKIKQEKQYVKFGISPFGIWRPGNPETIQGYDQYDKLFADAKLWLNKGWVDYYSPQLYWTIGKEAQSFPVLLDWWKDENTENRHLWPGIRVDTGGGLANTTEIINQLQISRAILKPNDGVIHWSIGSLLKDRALSKALVDGPYKRKAIVPASPWLCSTIPSSPVVSQTNQGATIRFQWNDYNTNTKQYIVYYRYQLKQWQYEIVNSSQKFYELSSANTDGKSLVDFGVTATNRVGCQSPFIAMSVQ